jgi:hypothetical protein
MTAADAEPPGRAAAHSGRRHGVHRFLGRLHAVMDGVSTETVWALSPEELAECLVEAYAAQARLSALTLGLVAQADRSGLAAHEGVVGLVAWLRDRVRLAPAEAKRQVRLAAALEEHPVIRSGLADGAFPAASAAVITETLTRLAKASKVRHDLDGGGDAEVLVRAEEYLAGEAYAQDTHTLRRLAAHLDEVIDPEGADARLAAQLARAEATALQETFLHLRHDELSATSEGSFRIPLVSGAKLARMLEALTNPGRPDPIPFQDPVTGVGFSAEERRGQALVELLDRVPVKKLPKLGGSDPVVVVTMELATLLGGLRAAHLDTGEVISPGAARRLAARAKVVPAVLGSEGQVLDLGHAVRLYQPPQRLAMSIQQGGRCAVRGCTRPAAGCDAHHLDAWSEGGPTDLAGGVLICPPHHTYVHHPDYQVTRLGPGRIELHRRC